MNHEKRIKQLEEEVYVLKQQLKELLRNEEKWMSLSEAYTRFDISPCVLRRKIKSGELKHLRDWKQNGRTYLVNGNSIKKIQ